MIKSKVEFIWNDKWLLNDVYWFIQTLKGFMKMSEALFVFGVFILVNFWEQKRMNISFMYSIVSSDFCWRSPCEGWDIWHIFAGEKILMGGFVFHLAFLSLLERTSPDPISVDFCYDAWLKLASKTPTVSKPSFLASILIFGGVCFGALLTS